MGVQLGKKVLNDQNFVMQGTNTFTTDNMMFQKINEKSMVLETFEYELEVLQVLLWGILAIKRSSM